MTGQEIETVPAKYVYLDVVGFTHDRSVEAQTEIVAVLNTLVRDALARYNLTDDQLILLPTGDGLCIAILENRAPFDVHLTVALEILARLRDHNEKTTDKMRQFALRIGANENVDNVVVDINGRRNIAGAGINAAQRIMTFSEENQLFVGQTVHETLVQREKYMSSFRKLSKVIKHGVSMTAYQYVSDNSKGLNSATPSAFVVKSSPSRKLSRVVAYYVGQAASEREFLMRNNRGQDEYAAVCLMWFLAEDHVTRETTPDFKEPTVRAPRLSSRAEQLKVLSEPHFWAIAELSDYIKQEQLSPFYDCFADDQYGMADYRFVSERGLRRLKDDHPDIWERFNSASGQKT